MAFTFNFQTIQVLATMVLFFITAEFYVNAFLHKSHHRNTPFRCKVLSSTPQPHVAVIGAGWGGWGAVKALCEGGYRVTLIDTSTDPTGEQPTKTASNKPVEPGQKGFWYDYPNIVQLINDLGLQESDIFTPYLNSSFWSPEGLEATAPVFSSSDLPQLPSPLGQVFASFKHFKRLPVIDRMTIAGLLYAILDLYRDEEAFRAYDRMSAYDLFANLGVSKRLIDDFLRPTLLVGLFKPPEELSAAVAMELLYYYALAHQTSFDVRWLKKGTVTTIFFAPLYRSLINRGFNLTVESKSRLNTLKLDGNKVSTVIYTKEQGMSSDAVSVTHELSDVDAVVLAVSTKGLQSILRSSSNLSYASVQLSRAASLKSIDCISCRLWIDRKVKTLSTANVFAKFPALRGAGGTFFMLDELQKDNIRELWGYGGSVDGADGSVVGVDFYNAGALLSLKDEDLLRIITEELLPEVDSQFMNIKVVDSSIRRYPEAVSWFSPGSYDCRPRTKVEGISNLFCAGDWVVIQDPSSGPGDAFPAGEHGSKGLCQERAYVSGLVAGNSAMLAITGNIHKLASIKPIRADEPQVVLGRLLNKQFVDGARKLLKFPISPPWLR